MSTSKGRIEPAKIWFIGSCVVAIFAYGVAVGRYQLFPFKVLNFGVASLIEVREEADVILGRVPSWHVSTARYDGDGVTIRQEDRMAPGLTLVAGMFDGENQLRLLEPDGTPVRIWPASYTELFPDSDRLESASRPRRDWNAQIHGALALPDGSTVLNFDYAGTVKFDQCGEVEWTLSEDSHHSIERSQDGGFWIPGRRYVNVVAGFPRSESGYDEDLILRVSDDGEVLESVPIADIFVDSDLLHLLLLKGPGTVFREGEIAHLNDIQELPDTIADRFPEFEGGDLVLSFRDEHLVMVVDPSSWTASWVQMGPWIQQHDPDFQPDGTITIFNNKNDNTAVGTHLGGSEIVELDPSTGTTRVLYGGAPGQEIHTPLLGKHQMLPNGNILITQARRGRVLEVTETGELVWELINRHDEELVAVVTSATRYPPSYFEEVEDWTCE